MAELEDWEIEESRSPDCDGAYWMMHRGRQMYLENLLNQREYKLIENPDDE